MSRYLAFTALIITIPARGSEPRFALEPGLELRFTAKVCSWFDSKDGKRDMPREADGSPKYEKSDLTVYVLGQQPDGSFRVLTRGISATGSPFITWADLFPDGKLALIPSATPILEHDSLRTIFPLLPKNEQEKTSGWSEVETRTDQRMRFSEADGTIRAECDGPLDRVSEGHRVIRYRLDPKTNLPSEISSDGRWDRYKESLSTIVTVQEITHHDGAWVTQFTAKATQYFETTMIHKRAQQNGVVSQAIAEREKPGAAGELLDRRKANLITARDAIVEPLFCADLDLLIKHCDEFRENRVETAKRWAKIAGLPAPDWKVADLSGKEHSMAQYRGQVVVLDFWFRQCSFCIRAMPQVEQAAGLFQVKKAPVSFFGVSIDKEECDAKFVADKMKLSYPVLRSEKLAEQFGVTGYPTLVVIAPDGTVQGIFVGYNHMLREELTSCIRELLKE